MDATFRILGPLEVVHESGAAALGGPRQRALLAVLLLHRDEVVPTDRLIDELWGESPPPTARQTVQVYVSQLRRALDAVPGGAILTRAPGYALEVDPGRLDVDVFEERLAAGARALRAGQAEDAARALREALAVWRGPPLADFAFDDFAQREIARLDERRLTCLEERIEADLALGRHHDLTAELESLVSAHPLRERLRGQLMRALYGSGRQADALAAYTAGRHVLADELGIEPGAELRDLERRILTQDPALDPPPATRPADPRGEIEAPPGRRTGGRRLAAAGAAVLAGALVAGMVLASRDGEALTVPGDSVVAIEAGGGRAGAPVDVGAAPSHVAVDGDAVWVGGASDGTVRRIDPSRRAVVQTIPLGSAPDGIAAAEGSVWVTSALEGVLVRISPRTNTIVQTIPLADGPRGVAVGEDAVWVAGLHGKTLTRVAPATGRRTWTRSIGGSPLGVTTTEGAVWVTNEADASVSRIDPRTGRVVQTIGVGNGPRSIAATADAVWVANTLDGTVSRIDPGRNAVTATVPVGAEPASLAAGDGGVWVANELAGTVERIDPRTNAVAETIRTGNRPSGLAHDGRRLWLATRDAAAAHRGGTLRASGGLREIDPSTAYEFELNLTGAGLTGYRRVGGAAGATLVPDLAVGLPTPGDGGRSYTFQLRTGVRYANGAPLRPADFRRALERFFRLGPVENVPYYDAIDGAAACRADRATCDLSRGIVADDRANTVTVRLTRPDPNLLFSLALSFAHPVAPGAPPRPATDRGLPGVGPYVIADHGRDGDVRFVRNPHFREWGGATRDGYPDEILLVPGDDVAAAVEDNRLDVGRLTLDLDRSGLDAIAARHPDRLRVTPAPVTLLVALNTTRAPFDDVNARRALALALDRDAMVDNIGGSRAAQPACQILPPNFPGHRPYCPFTTNPGADGAWEGPDLDEARALVARSGTAGQAVEVLSEATFSAQGRYVAGVLRRLGYRATARVLSTDGWFAAAYGPRGDALQVGLSGWLIDYPSPSTFFEQLRCGATDPSRFCDPAIDRQMDAALALQTTDPAAANAAWARVDRALTDQAPWIGYATPRFATLLSERAGNFQDHPVWGPLLEQIWVR